MPFARFGFPKHPDSGGSFARHSHAHLLVDTDGAWIDARSTLATLLWHARDADAGVCVHATPAAPERVSELCHRYGTDAVRWALLLGEGAPTERGGLSARVEAANDRVVAPLLRAVTMLLDAGLRAGWTVAELPDAPRLPDRPIHDRAMLAALADAVDAVRRALDAAALADAAHTLERLIGRLTDWWSSRSVPALPANGERTGIAEADAISALSTFHECLVTCVALLAPLAPFVCDEVYEQIVRDTEPHAPDSVHLLRYPTADPYARMDRETSREIPR